MFKPGALVFDIGAHHGESADMFLRYGAEKVVSVEASFDNYKELVAHWRDKMKEPRVVPIHAAVSSMEISLLQIFRCEKQSGLSTLLPDDWKEIYPDMEFTGMEYVPTITLDTLIRKFGRPEYIKIDVEGAELAVLHGLGSRVGSLSFEFHGKAIRDAVKCLDVCHSLGFENAAYVEEDVDLVHAPTRSIREIRAELLEKSPNWGNVTVT